MRKYQLSNGATPRVMSNKTFYRLKDFIESHIGICIPESKKVLVESRLLKRLRVLEMDNFDDYTNYLFSIQGEQDEIPRFVECITTNKTDFFREDDHFKYLTNHVYPELLQNNKTIRLIRLWSAASSIGEEAYTMAMVTHDYLLGRPGIDFKILATDISEEVLKIGRNAVYPILDAKPIPQKFLKRYCLKSKNNEKPTFRIVNELRRKVMFKPINLTTESYMITKKYNVIFLRNVMIYFNKETQNLILNNLYNHLEDDGYLFLGHSENLPSNNIPFKRVGPSIYVKKD